MDYIYKERKMAVLRLHSHNYVNSPNLFSELNLKYLC